MMEECDAISVVTEFMLGSHFGSMHDGGVPVQLSIAARKHLQRLNLYICCQPLHFATSQPRQVAASLDRLLISYPPNHTGTASSGTILGGVLMMLGRQTLPFGVPHQRLHSTF